MKAKLLVVFILMIALLLVSCKKFKDVDKDKIRDLEYTVLDESLCPEIVMEKIEAEKIQPFKFSYIDDEYIYIAIGYGEQATSDYSIQVLDLYETENNMIIRTQLLGPQKGEQPVETPTYPYIVIKTEKLDKDVCYR